MSPIEHPIAYASALAALHAQCFAKPWSEDEIKTLLTLPTTILWITAQGFLMCSKIADEMEILTIGVLPAYRRQHIASNFLQSMLNYASQNDIHGIFLEVSITNQPAQALYYRFGFQEIGRRRGYYRTEQGAVDALCLKRII